MSINKSGIYPMANRVLVKPDEPVKKGKIEMPEGVLDRQVAAGTIGTLIAKGRTAFREDYVNFNVDTTPDDGSRIIFSKWAGLELRGKDGIKYRMLYDKDVLAFAESDVTMEIS